MYKKDGRVFSVPEITTDKDIVDFYGPPGGGTAEAPEVSDPSRDRSADDESTRETKPASLGGVTSGREPGDKPAPRAAPDAASLLLLVVPFGAAWLRPWRFNGMAKRSNRPMVGRRAD